MLPPVRYATSYLFSIYLQQLPHGHSTPLPLPTSIPVNYNNVASPNPLSLGRAPTRTSSETPLSTAPEFPWIAKQRRTKNKDEVKERWEED